MEPDLSCFLILRQLLHSQETADFEWLSHSQIQMHSALNEGESGCPEGSREHITRRRRLLSHDDTDSFIGAEYSFQCFLLH